jgi:hypothetical protein
LEHNLGIVQREKLVNVVPPTRVRPIGARTATFCWDMSPTQPLGKWLSVSSQIDVVPASDASGDISDQQPAGADS